MSREPGMPRNALLWIMLAQVLLLLPHLGRLPLWVPGLYLLTLAWRTTVYRGRGRLPGRWLKIALILTALFGVGVSYGSVIGLEPTVALLLVAYALKLLECAERKDGYVVVFLGFFVCTTEFLFSQDLLIVLYSLGVVWILTTALVALHRPARGGDLPGLKLSGVMLLQAVPLMLVLFFLFPRIGPLWNVPMRSQAAQSGVSDSMQPGDISQLVLSSDVAFRATFDSDVPGTAQLYWRGLVMSRLEEGAWKSLSPFDTPIGERRQRGVEKAGEALDYRVILEPTQQQWLYALAYAEPRQGGILQTPDFRLQSPVAIEQETLYRVRSWPQATIGLALSDWRRRLETRLPPGSHPRTQALARELRAQSVSAQDYIQRVLARFRREPFRYTLNPPLLDNHSMDQFLFETRAGFCEHYAYAFAVLMRAADVPARVVAGYQGGEINPVNGTVIVHEFDAHAWNEVWLEGQGWVRVDPTAAVSPDRIELGLEAALREEGSFLAGSPLSPLRFRNIDWINALRLRYDALTYQWQSWVVGFDNTTQTQVLQGLLGRVDAQRVGLIVLGSLALVLGVVSLSLVGGHRRRHARDPALREYRRLQKKLERGGIVPAGGDSASGLLARAAQRYPAVREELRLIDRLLRAALYQPLDTSRQAQTLRVLRRRIRRLRLAGQRRPRR
jgi:transglutaminase-like putative cysteine protease